MRITVFTTSTCAYCPYVKRYLNSKGLHYDEVNLDEYPERREEAYRRSGALTVPITIAEDGHKTAIIVGWKPAELAKL